MVENLYVGSFVEVVIVAILFKIHFTQMIGSVCLGAPVRFLWSTFNILSRSVVFSQEIYYMEL
jgi:hypothetical protein